MNGTAIGQVMVLSVVLSAGLAAQTPEGARRAAFLKMIDRPRVALAPQVSGDRFSYAADAEQRVPGLWVRPQGAGKHPVVIVLHGTGGTKEGQLPVLKQLAAKGFLAVAIDGRYYGDREKAVKGQNKYVEAIIQAWQSNDKSRQEHPIFYDTAYDSWKLVDYLLTRADVDPKRIGMMGVSKGGIETILAASVDTRIKVAVPVIAAQSFKWSLENDRWQGRAKTIWNAHLQVAKDLGDSSVNKKNVSAFWNKLIPGITDEFDIPSMIRLFSPRPLLVLNTEEDQNCPLPGAKLAFEAATNTYRGDGALDKLKIDIELHQPHRYTPKHMDMTIEWFKKWL